MSLGIYIHLPYCLTKCPYCDFNSYGVGGNFPEEDYTSAVLREIDLYSGYISDNLITSIFFGGGTPSLFNPENIGKMIKKVGEYADFAEGIEISLEINPKTSNYEKIHHLKDVGINRVSVGIQSFSDRKLKFYGRLNTPDEGKEVLRDISDARFKNFNIDLIYGSTSETIDELERDIDTSLEFNTTHISAYCLTIEDGTQFGNLYKRGLLKLPGDDLLSEMYGMTASKLSGSGYEHYEISNYCRPGYECRHNLIYWECENYIGVGAGAHSHMNSENGSNWGKRWSNIKNPNKYMGAIKEDHTAQEFNETLARTEAATDKLIMGLRLKKGINVRQFENRYGTAFDLEKLNVYIQDEMIELTDETLRITDKGRIFSNELIYKAVESLEFLN